MRGFGLNAYSAAAPGDELIEDHVEGDESGGHQELYVVLQGRARFAIDGEEVLRRGREPASSSPIRPRAGTRSATRRTRWCSPWAAIRPRAYTVSSWEERFRARGIYEAGEPGEAVAILRAASVERPEDASTLYDLACLEALTGDGDDALEHLKAAIAIRPEFRERAAQDGDLDAVRDRDDFPR